ncbi:putative porin [Methylocucumis oryzae]|uniref:putative porin n=1 Tax=Methylocucumis oryzae TaxID=1632867 RepID=UPI000AD8E46F|nr:putative porin [Methylocucumis oryzae]
MDKKQQLLALALCGLVGMAYAGEKEELLKLRNTTTNLIKELVKQGILTQQAAEEMIKRAEADAEAQAQQQAAAPGNDEPLEPGEVRVPYVPEFVKDEIREQVRKELKADVVKDVVQEAKSKKWGVPDALPEWISRFKLSGDLRLRSQNEFMDSDNNDTFYADYQSINAAGGITAARNNAFINTRQDRHRLRERLRLAIDAKITEGLNAGVRLATSNIPDPVSTNQTLGNTGSHYAFNVDRAFLRYDAVDAQGFKWLTLSGGRVANPWYVGGGEFTGGSELVWDTDLSFEGLVGTIRHRLTSTHPTHPEEDNRHSAFFTLGAFPLQESQLTSNDKWLFGSQLGVDWGFDNHDVFRMALAYFDYENVEAVPSRSSNPICSNNIPLNDLSVPQFVQFGNTMALICNENNSSVSGALGGLYGLASDFNIINFAIAYDLAKICALSFNYCWRLCEKYRL